MSPTINDNHERAIHCAFHLKAICLTDARPPACIALLYVHGNQNNWKGNGILGHWIWVKCSLVLFTHEIRLISMLPSINLFLPPLHFHHSWVPCPHQNSIWVSLVPDINISFTFQHWLVIHLFMHEKEAEAKHSGTLRLSASSNSRLGVVSRNKKNSFFFVLTNIAAISTRRRALPRCVLQISIWLFGIFQWIAIPCDGAIVIECSIIDTHFARSRSTIESFSNFLALERAGGGREALFPGRTRQNFIFTTNCSPVFCCLQILSTHQQYTT